MVSVRPGNLACSNGCPEGRFLALNAPLFVDRSGTYLGHDASRATYVCAVCEGVAIDIASVAREMELRAGAGSPVALVCPMCGIAMLPPEDDPLAPLLECPACAARFAIEEGLRRLHGGEVPDTDAIDEGYGEG